LELAEDSAGPSPKVILRYNASEEHGSQTNLLRVQEILSTSSDLAQVWGRLEKRSIADPQAFEDKVKQMVRKHFLNDGLRKGLHDDLLSSISLVPVSTLANLKVANSRIDLPISDQDLKAELDTRLRILFSASSRAGTDVDNGRMEVVDDGVGGGADRLVRCRVALFDFLDDFFEAWNPKIAQDLNAATIKSVRIYMLDYRPRKTQPVITNPEEP
jgi:hypothetical protein